MKTFQIGMLDGFFNSDSCFRVHVQHSIQEVNAVCVFAPSDLSEVLLFLFWKALDVGPCVGIHNLAYHFLSWGSSLFNDEVNLIDIVFTRKENLSREDLSKCAPYGPNVSRVVVFVAGKHYFRGSIKSGHHVLG